MVVKLHKIKGRAKERKNKSLLGRFDMSKVSEGFLKLRRKNFLHIEYYENMNKL